MATILRKTGKSKNNYWPQFWPKETGVCNSRKKINNETVYFESPKDKGEGRIDFFAFGKNILTGDFTIKIIDDNLNVYIEKMTIKINGQPEQVKMALREDTVFYLEGFKVDSKTYSPIGGTLKEEKFTEKY